MIAEALAYFVVVAALVGLAATGVERVLAEIGRPRRFAWLVAYAAALALPLASLWWAANAPSAAATSMAGHAAASLKSRALEWDTALAGLWAGATALLLLAYSGAWIRLARRARRWDRVQRGNATVLVSEEVGPAVFGIRSACVILPRWLVGSPASVQDTVIAHELEHIAARDQVSIVASQLVTVLLPWNLPLWWFARRLRAAIEIDCDARVLRRGVDSEHYADVLLVVAARRSPTPDVAAALIERTTGLQRRIRIMVTKRRFSFWRAGTAAGVVAVLAACIAQVETPSIATPSVDDATFPSAQIVSAKGVVSLTRNPTGQVTVRAPEITMRIPREELRRGTAERFSETGSFVLEGNVRFEGERTSITASRAVAESTSDGGMIVTLTDATVVGPYDAETLLSE